MAPNKLSIYWYCLVIYKCQIVPHGAGPLTLMGPLHNSGWFFLKQLVLFQCNMKRRCCCCCYICLSHHDSCHSFHGLWYILSWSQSMRPRQHVLFFEKRPSRSLTLSCSMLGSTMHIYGNIFSKVCQSLSLILSGCHENHLTRNDFGNLSASLCPLSQPDFFLIIRSLDLPKKKTSEHSSNFIPHSFSHWRSLVGGFNPFEKY